MQNFQQLKAYYISAYSCYQFRHDFVNFFDFFLGLFMFDLRFFERIFKSAKKWLAEKTIALTETDEDDLQFQIAYRKANFLFLEKQFREKIYGCEQNMFIKVGLQIKIDYLSRATVALAHIQGHQ